MTDVYDLRERFQWQKGKSSVIAKYSEEHDKMLAEIAGRGFLSLPGYAYDLENQLELMAKLNLSDLNYKILSETIDRELKQAGIDYSIEYRNAVMAWEILKQQLMAAWDAEYAGIKQGMASDEETLNMLAIQVSLRGVTLIESKTALELSMETYRKALVELDGTTAPYEVQLAQAKLLTAQKKLEIIPIIQEIIVKEQELLAVEQTKAAAYTGLIAAEQSVSNKKEQGLLPVVNELATLSEQYASKIANEQIPIEREISGEKITQSQIAVEKAAYQIEELTTEIATENKQLTLMNDKRTLEEIQFAHDQDLVKLETNQTSTIHNDEMGRFNTTLQEERDATAKVIADKTSAHTIKNQTRLRSETTITSEEISADVRSTAAEVERMQQVAAAEAAGKITAQLTHLIGP